MSSDEEVDEPAQPGMAQSIGMRMQKKLLGMTVKSKAVVKAFVDDNTGELLDHVFELAKRFYGDQKLAKKLVKDLLKIIVKVGFLYHKKQLSDEEIGIGLKLQGKIKMSILTALSYHDVAFTFDAPFLISLISNIKELLRALIARHLTDKSKERVENVFRFFSSADMLTKLYTDPSYKDVFEAIVRCLHRVNEPEPS